MVWYWKSAKSQRNKAGNSDSIRPLSFGCAKYLVYLFKEKLKGNSESAQAYKAQILKNRLYPD
jgi:hypothetical protein